MRYSVAAGGPNDFKDNCFTLRQIHDDPPRRTDLFIVMTMYNEDGAYGEDDPWHHEEQCKRDHSKTWGKDGWKKVVVCIVRRSTRVRLASSQL